MVWRTDEHQSVRRRRWPFFRLGQRRGATQLVAGLRRRSSRLAGSLRRRGPRSVSGLHRTELDRYTAEESAREAGRGPRFLRSKGERGEVSGPENLDFFTEKSLV